MCSVISVSVFCATLFKRDSSNIYGPSPAMYTSSKLITCHIELPEFIDLFSLHKDEKWSTRLYCSPVLCCIVSYIENQYIRTEKVAL